MTKREKSLKLTLKRKAIRRLEDPEIKRVAGGLPLSDGGGYGLDLPEPTSPDASCKLSIKITSAR